MIGLVVAAWALCFLCWPNCTTNDYRGFVETKVVVVLMAVAWCAALRLPKRLKRAMLACFAALFISWWLSVNTTTSVFGLMVQPAYGLIAMSLYAVLFCNAHAMPPVAPKHFARLGAAVGAMAWIQKLGLDPLIALARLPNGRAMGWVGSPVDLGAILAMLLAFCGPWTGLCATLGLWACGSRGAWLAAACGLLARRWPKLTPYILAASLFIVFIPARKAEDVARAQTWRSAVQTFRRFPVFGAGPSTFVLTFTGDAKARFDHAMGGPGHTQGHAHNDLLEAAASTGLVGLLAYLWFLSELTWAPALVALFVNMKVNPMGIDVLAIAAIIAGAAI
jgi:hypothetical protein